VNGRGKRILVLHRSGDETCLRPTVLHHLRSFRQSPRRHQVVYYDIKHGAPARLGRFPFDAVLLHYTLLALRWHQFAWLRRELAWLADVPWFKIAVPQDEYDHHAVLDEWLDELGVQCIFTCFDGRQRAVLYPKMHAKAAFVQCLTGYIDDAMANRCEALIRPLDQRPLDVVYRGSRLPYWYGAFGQVKHLISLHAQRAAQQLGLRHDISTRPEDVLLGDDWFRFLASGRATIGCESGVSAVDPRGEVRRQANALLRDKPDLSFAEFSERLPRGWDGYSWRALGPRHLEAVMTRTAQVLVEGEYSGVLVPYRHYIPVKADFSNLSEALEQVRDTRRLSQLTACAYEEVFLSRRYHASALAELLDQALDQAQARGQLPDRRGWVSPFALTRVGVQSVALAGRARLRLHSHWQAMRMACTEQARRVREGRPLQLHWSNPVGRVLKTAALVKAYLCQEPLRAFVRACLAERRQGRAITLQTFLRDAMRWKLLLDLARGAQLGHLDIRLQFEPAAGLLSLVVRPPQPVEFDSPRDAGRVETFWHQVGEALRDQRVRFLVWDHSALGMVLSKTRGFLEVQYAIGIDGKYRFQTLLDLVPRHPDVVLRLLRAIAPQGEVVAGPAIPQGRCA
jgi:hypothetical protein